MSEIVTTHLPGAPVAISTVGHAQTCCSCRSSQSTFCLSLLITTRRSGRESIGSINRLIFPLYSL